MKDENAGATEETGRDINRRYYETPAAGRDDYWRKMAAPRFRVAEILTLVEDHAPESLVDLGCGNGRLLEEISARLPIDDLAGIDLSSTQIEANRRTYPDIEWHRLDLEEPLPTSSKLTGHFDIVVASEIIEHLQWPDRFLVRARELVKPERGKLILSTQSGKIRETERRVGHVRHFTREDLETLLDDAGWSPIRIWNCGFPFHDMSKWYANRNPDRSMARFGNLPYGTWESTLALVLRFAFKLNSRRRGAQLFAVARRGRSG